MANSVEICSDAIVELGGKPIVNFTATQLAIDAGRLYALERARILRLHPWRFLRRTALLETPKGSAPDFDWSYQFDLPADCIRVWRVGKRDQLLPYEMKGEAGVPGGVLMTTNAKAPLVYSANVDEANWPAWFADLMQVCMQARLAYRVTNSRTLGESKKGEAAQVLSTVKGVHGSEEPMAEFGGSSDILSGRY